MSVSTPTPTQSQQQCRQQFLCRMPSSREIHAQVSISSLEERHNSSCLEHFTGMLGLMWWIRYLEFEQYAEEYEHKKRKGIHSKGFVLLLPKRMCCGENIYIYIYIYIGVDCRAAVEYRELSPRCYCTWLVTLSGLVVLEWSYFKVSLLIYCRSDDCVECHACCEQLVVNIHMM